MKKLIIASVAAILSGCAVTKAEWGGEEVITNSNGDPVILNGAVQKVAMPVKLYSNRHWFDTHIDQAHLEVKNGDILFVLNGYSGECSSNAVAYIDTCFSGIATITEKVCAAIITSGGSVAANGGSSAIFALAAKFISAGGDALKAKVSCVNGKCSVSDGLVTCTDEDCSICSDCSGGNCTK